MHYIYLIYLRVCVCVRVVPSGKLFKNRRASQRAKFLSCHVSLTIADKPKQPQQQQQLSRNNINNNKLRKS